MDGSVIVRPVVIFTRANSAEVLAEQVHEAQEAACRSHAEAEGWRVAGVYRDTGDSPNVLDREPWQALLDRVRSGGADIVMAQTADRISRDETSLVIISQAIRQAGGELRFARSKFDGRGLLGEVL